MNSLLASMGIAGLPALYAVLACVVTLAVFLAMPRPALGGRASVLLLGSLASALVVYLSHGFTGVVVGFAASHVFTALGLYDDTRSGRALPRAFVGYAALGTLPLVVAWFLLHGHERGPLPTDQQELVFWLLAATAMFRSAVIPLHSWLPALVERGPLWTAASFFAAPLGPFVMLRALEFSPETAHARLPVTAAVTVASALYCSFVALAQTNLRRAVGFVLAAQSALSLSALCEPDVESVHGALVQLPAVGLSAAGLLLVLACLEQRTGTSDLGRLGGEGRRFPRLTTYFFLFAAAAIGLPGSLHFVAEDLLLHGLMHNHVAHAVGLLLATTLLGVTLLRLFFTVFQGPFRPAGSMAARASDVPARKMVVFAGLVLGIAMLGVFPQRALDLVDEATHRVNAAEHVAPVAQVEDPTP